MTYVRKLLAFSALLLINVLAVTPASAGPGDCPVFSAKDIDDYAEQVGLSALNDHDVKVVACVDDSTSPMTRMRLTDRTEKSRILDVAVGYGFDDSSVATPGEPTGKIIAVADPFDIDDQYDNLPLSDLHICRGELLRSYTWRRLCESRVNRSSP